MSDDREKFADLLEWLNALRDSTISDEQMKSLDRLLAADADAREYYLQYVSLCTTLGRFQGTLTGEREPHSAGGSSVQEERGTTPRNGSAFLAAMRRRLLALVAAMVLLGIGLSVFYFPLQNGPLSEHASDGERAVAAEAVAVLTRAVQSQWEGDAPAIGSRLRARERLRLRSGIAQLEFYSGAVLVIEGPADFEPTGVDRVYCREGRIRARISRSAEGFTIVSPTVELVDRGTEFGFRIDRAGGAEVHVFRGKVELRSTTHSSLRADSPNLTTGNGVRIDPNGVFRKIAADPKAFVSTADMEQEWRDELQRRHERWLAYSQKLRADTRLVLYYTFQDQRQWERTLLDRSLLQEGTIPGTIIGCEWSEGRWLGKGALDFKRPSDRVRLDVPGEYQSLTFLAWVRVDAFEQQLNALMLTDGFDKGAPHWQLTAGGAIRLCIRDRYPAYQFHDYDSPAFLGPDQLGKWLQLATVYDHRSRTVAHYVNGKPISGETIHIGLPLRIGKVEIGNWGRPFPSTGLTVRNFNGRIDEFALFREALSPEEIARLHEIGKTSP